jgi:hypothetical protein
VSNEEQRRTGDNGLPEELAPESFDELVWYTGGGFLGGLLAAAVLDWFGFQQNPVGQWFVRTLAGEGESIFEGVFAIGRRLRGRAGSMAEAYGWGKLVGMTAPWGIDLVSRLLGVDVYGIEGFYIPYFYAMSDQIGANVAGMIFLHRTERSWFPAVIRYLRHPVMLASLGVILLVPVGLLVARLLGFSPTTQVLTAVETIASNLCWVPPVVGWIAEKRKRSLRRAFSKSKR